MMPRFVILHHEMPPESTRSNHWDLMLEHGSHLETWELPVAPRVGTQLKIVPLANHRVEYLDYEGPLTNHRGTVTRHDWGRYIKISDDEYQQVVILQGQSLTIRLTIEKQSQTGKEVELRIDAESSDLQTRTEH